MNATTAPNWIDANQRYLTGELARVRGYLEEGADKAVAVVASENDNSFALSRLCEAFGLSSFERDVLLLCAGIELDARFAHLCGQRHQDEQRAWPTWSLALSALPEAHWSALTPQAPLRRWRLIEAQNTSSLTQSALRIDERILHFLCGLNFSDERLSHLLEAVPAGALVPSHESVADNILAVWQGARETLPVIHLAGEEISAKRIIAASACAQRGWALHRLDATVLPANLVESEPLLRLWEREARLLQSALLLDCEEIDGSDATRLAAVSWWVERCGGVLLVASRERLNSGQRAIVRFEVRKPTMPEQRTLWRNALGEVGAQLNGHIEQLSTHFDVGSNTIEAASVEALGQILLDEAEVDSEQINRAVWLACRQQARPRLDDLAQRIESGAGWEDIVLPEAQSLILRDIAAHVRQRGKVYEHWGFGGKGTRGLGISALFAGVSGTGKTLSAEVIANELHLDLYRIDLSAVVSKYIGETEKNLARVFDAAEAGGAVLLFDEADALFGKRSEVKDSHDRHANIEVSYLLQCMESYRGLAILTTNLKTALDTAFLRRIRFVVQFPFPDAAQRAEIWRRVFPPQTPTAGLDAEKLAQLNVAGGNIRNMALNAAFIAADADEPVSMMHLLRAAQSEYAKLEKTLTGAEVAGWVPHKVL
jgi:hypothetical protein